jgi:hypothetical protein
MLAGRVFIGSRSSGVCILYMHAAVDDFRALALRCTER